MHGGTPLWIYVTMDMCHYGHMASGHKIKINQQKTVVSEEKGKPLFPAYYIIKDMEHRKKQRKFIFFCFLNIFLLHLQRDFRCLKRNFNVGKMCKGFPQKCGVPRM